MPWIPGNTGQPVDVNPQTIGGNQNTGIFVDLRTNANAPIAPPPLARADPMSVAIGTYGSFYKVPDTSIVGRAYRGITSIGLGYYELHDTAGGITVIPVGDVIATASMWQWTQNFTKSDYFEYSDCSVRLTATSRNALVTMGIISASTPLPQGSNTTTTQIDDPNVPDILNNSNLGSTFKLGAGIIVLAIVAGLAIYFLPRNALKGGG